MGHSREKRYEDSRGEAALAGRGAKEIDFAQPTGKPAPRSEEYIFTVFSPLVCTLAHIVGSRPSKFYQFGVGRFRTGQDAADVALATIFGGVKSQAPAICA